MSAPLSVVIPTLDAAEALGPTLEALVPGLAAGLIRELILVDGGSSDEIEAIADAVGAELIRTEPGRGVQLAAGADAARGNWLLFLHGDTRLPPGWQDRVRAHIEAHPDAAGYFGLRFDSEAAMARVVAGWANLRARLFALPYGDQALLLPNVLYCQVGGYPAVPLMEDVALIRRLGRKRVRRLPGYVTTSAERYVRAGWVRRGGRNLTTLALYFLGASPAWLAERYRRP
ncbi:MAG: TIGR04283 family arsenosugar biosynthesis glycosyltransferase [Pseudomonadota bacterium]